MEKIDQIIKIANQNFEVIHKFSGFTIENLGDNIAYAGVSIKEGLMYIALAIVAATFIYCFFKYYFKNKK